MVFFAASFAASSLALATFSATTLLMLLIASSFLLLTTSSSFALLMSSFAVVTKPSTLSWAAFTSVSVEVPWLVLRSCFFCSAALVTACTACVLTPVSFASWRSLSTASSLCAFSISSSNFFLSSLDKPRPPSRSFASAFLFFSWTWASPSRAFIYLLRSLLAVSRSNSSALGASYSFVALSSCWSNGSLVAFDAWVYLTASVVFSSSAVLITCASSFLLRATRTLFISSVPSAWLIASWYGFSSSPDKP